MTALCRHCNKPESEHHEFEAYVVPVGCKCDLTEWNADPGPICAAYDDGEGWGNCNKCEHLRECHK